MIGPQFREVIPLSEAASHTGWEVRRCPDGLGSQYRPRHDAKADDEVNEPRLFDHATRVMAQIAREIPYQKRLEGLIN